MAKIKKEPKPIKDKLNTSTGKKNQKQKKDVKTKGVKDIKVKVIKPKRVKNKIRKEETVDETPVVINEDLKKLQVDQCQLKSGIDALLKYFGKTKDKDVFETAVPVFAQFNCIKIPQGPCRRLRVSLKHSILTHTSEVCLIVPDLRKGRRIDHEGTIEHYETLLKQKGVTGITRILPFRQLKIEYDQHELKRRLCGYYDHFITDGRISGHVSHCLGRLFYEKRKLPVPIRMTNQDLRYTIEEAFKKVQINIHSGGTTFGVHIGHNGMTVDMLQDNLETVIMSLESKFPGGWDNIRSLYVGLEKSISVPVYVTLRSCNKVAVPVTKALRPKMFKQVHGELSTRYDADISVNPSGEIIINKFGEHIYKPLEMEEDAADNDNNDVINEEDDDKLAASAEEAYMAELLLKELQTETTETKT